MSNAPVLRGANGHWLKGSSGNPGGRRRGPLYLAQEILKRSRDGVEFVDFAFEVFRDPAREFADRKWAAEILIERSFGKSSSTLELSVSPGDSQTLDFSKLSEEQFETLHSLASECEPLPEND